MPNKRHINTKHYSYALCIIIIITRIERHRQTRVFCFSISLCDAGDDDVVGAVVTASTSISAICALGAGCYTRTKLYVVGTNVQRVVYLWN